MNWFLLIVIIELYDISWTAPIDLLEANNEFQAEKDALESISNKTFTMIGETYNLTKAWENMLNSTDSTYNTSSLNAILNKNIHKISEDFETFNSEVQKELEHISGKYKGEKTSGQVREAAVRTSSEHPSHKEEIKADEFPSTSLGPMDNATEHIGGLQENANYSNDKYIFSIRPVDVEPVATKVVNNLDNSSNDSAIFLVNGYNNKDFSGFAANKDKMNKIVEVLQNEIIVKSANKTEESYPIPTILSVEEITERPDIISRQITQVASTIPIILEYPYDELGKYLNHSHIFIENVTEKANKRPETSYITKQAGGNPNSLRSFETSLKGSITNTEETTTSSSISMEDSNGASYKPNAQILLFSNDDDVQMQNTREEITINQYPQESFRKNPDLGSEVGSFLNQAGQSNEKLPEELKINYTITKPLAKSSNTHAVLNKNINETEDPYDLNSEEASKQSPIFRQAMERTFIENVLEIGSKLVSIPEKTLDTQLPTTTESFDANVNHESISSADQNTTPMTNTEQFLVVHFEKFNGIAGDLNTNITEENLLDKTKETVTTTPSLIQNLKDPHYNKQEEVKNSESSDFSESFQNFQDSVSNGKTPSVLLSRVENKLEAITESSSKSLTENTDNEEQNTLQNFSLSFEVPSSQAPLQNFDDVATKTFDEDQQDIAVFATTDKPIENFQIPNEIVKIVEDDRQNNYKKMHPLEGKENVNKENLAESESKQNVQPSKIAESESEIKLTSATQQLKLGDHFDTTLSNKEIKSSEKEDPESLASVLLVETEKSETKETRDNETNSSRNAEYENITHNQIYNTETENSTASSQIIQENYTNAVMEAADNAFNKFENALKMLVENKYLKQEKTTQPEIITPLISTSPIGEFTTLSDVEETTVLPQNFKEELQAAAKGLEETVHRHFEEFSNNLKQASNKIPVWETKHKTQEKSITFQSILDETTIEPVTMQPTTIKPEDKTNAISYTPEEYHFSGEVDENLGDTFQNSKITNSLQQIEKLMLKPQKSADTLEPTTDSSPIVFTTILPDTEKMQTFKLSEDVTAIQNNVKKDISAATTDNSAREESASETDTPTTEYTSDTTTAPVLATVPFQMDINTNLPKTDMVSVTKVPTQTDEVNKSHSELATTIPSAVPLEETNNLRSRDSNLNEIPKFIEHTDTATRREPYQNVQTDEVNKTHSELAATIPSPVPLEETITLRSPEYSLKEIATFIEHTDTATRREPYQNVQTDEVNKTHSELAATIPSPVPLEETITLRSPEYSLKEIATFIEHTDTATRREPYQNVQTDEVNKTHSELAATIPSPVPLEETITLRSPEYSLKEIATFIEHTDTATRREPYQNVQTDEINKTHSELAATIPSPVPLEETITLRSPESNLKEMVTFIEHTDTTTKREPYQREDEEPSATFRIQELLTQSSVMAERQQQIESATEHDDAKSQTTTVSEQITTHEEYSEQQTTEAKIYSATSVEENETTVAPDARLLSLPPPKLEYIQNEDGVEVFYGYSIVKHN